MRPNVIRGLQAPAGTCAVVLGAFAGPALAQSGDQGRIEALEARVETLETREGFRLPGGATGEIYGYVKGDVIFDSDFDLGDTIFGLADIGTAGGPAEGEASRAHARQSRLGFRATRPTDAGEVFARIEGDFFGGTSGAPEFRLRHAYGEFQGLLVGQTWTNFMPIESYPATVDFQGPAGLPFVRQGQVRYTYTSAQGVGFSASVEDDPGDSDRVSVTGAVFYEADNYFLKLAGLSREVNTDTGDEDGWGVNLSGNAELWQGGRLNASYTTGEAIGSFMVFGGMDVDDDGEAIETEGWNVGIAQDVADFTFGIQYGYREIDDFAGAAGDDTETLETVHLTAQYAWTDNVNVGLEYIYGEREEFGGSSFDNDRVQFAVQYTF